MKLHPRISVSLFAAIRKDSLCIIVFDVGREQAGVCGGMMVPKSNNVDIPITDDIGMRFNGETGQVVEEASNTKLTVLAWRKIHGPWTVFDERCTAVLPIIDEKVDPT